MLDVALIATVVGVLIPLITTLATKLHASGWLKTGVAVLLAALASLLTWATSVTTGKVTYKDLIVQALLALAVAGGSRVSWVGSFETVLAKKTANVGLGAAEPTVDPDYTIPKVPAGG